MIPAHQPILNSGSRYIRLQGGAGSGKSIAVAQKILYHVMTEKGHRVFAFRKVGRTVKNSLFATFEDLIRELDVGRWFHVNKTEKSFTFWPLGTQIICGGMDDPEKVKSIKDPTIIWMEEATEFNYQDFEQLNLRLRKAGILNQLILTYNPISTENFIYKRFHVDGELRGVELFLKSTYRDNPYVTDDYRRSLERLAETNQKAYKVYNLGEWANLAEGIIYTDYEVIEEIPSFSREKNFYGVDFGFVDPMALVEVVIKDGDLFVDCPYYETERTIDHLAERMKKMGIKSNDLVYCDSARPGDIQSLNNKGFRGADKAVKGQGSILSGIEKVKEYKLHITESSVDLIDELNKYCYIMGRDGKLLEKPIDDFNHALDAMRYAVYSHTYKPKRGAKRSTVPKAQKIRKRRI